MMDIRELRIGNFVKIHEITTTLEYTDFRFNPEFITPIQLTEEWLLKFGFKYHAADKNYVITTQKDWHNSIKEIDGDWCYNNNFSDANCYFVREVKYVHQLQNLYYALNEEEL